MTKVDLIFRIIVILIRECVIPMNVRIMIYKLIKDAGYYITDDDTIQHTSEIPIFKVGDVIKKKTDDEPSMTVEAIVGGNYKLIWWEAFPRFEPFEYINENYELV